MKPSITIIRKVCDECGAVFEQSEEEENGIKKRQKAFPETVEYLKQRLICCEDCAPLRMVKI